MPAYAQRGEDLWVVGHDLVPERSRRLVAHKSGGEYPEQRRREDVEQRVGGHLDQERMEPLIGVAQVQADNVGPP